MKIEYEPWQPEGESLAIVRRAERICADYADQGYDLTLRQLYYQFVARALIPNTQQSYKRLGSLVNKGRMAGLLDWDYIVDRTRNLQSLSHWAEPAEIIEGSAYQYRIDKWASQPFRVEVWVEKEALAGVVQRAADEYDVAWFSCRGYVSQSEMWGAAQRLGRYIANDQRVVILHLGDHDPSGIDMTRDIRDRLTQFIAVDANPDQPDHEATMEDIGLDQFDGFAPLKVRRIALNYEQVRAYRPPPNPTKTTDSRAREYIKEYGTESWELDALEPAVLSQLIADGVGSVLDQDRYDREAGRERRERRTLQRISDNYSEVAEFVARGDQS